MPYPGRLVCRSFSMNMHSMLRDGTMRAALFHMSTMGNKGTAMATSGCKNHFNQLIT